METVCYVCIDDRKQKCTREMTIPYPMRITDLIVMSNGRLWAAPFVPQAWSEGYQVSVKQGDEYISAFLREYENTCMGMHYPLFKEEAEQSFCMISNFKRFNCEWEPSRNGAYIPHEVEEQAFLADKRMDILARGRSLHFDYLLLRDERNRLVVAKKMTDKVAAYSYAKIDLALTNIAAERLVSVMQQCDVWKFVFQSSYGQQTISIKTYIEFERVNLRIPLYENNHMLLIDDFSR